MKVIILKTEYWRLTLKRAFGGRFFCAVLLICIAFFLDTDIGARNILLGKYSPQGHENVLFYLQPLLRYGNNYKLYLAIMTMGFVVSITEAWKDGIVPYMTAGLGLRKYAVGQIVISAVSGGLAVAAGFVLYLLWMSINIPMMPENLEANEVYSYLAVMPWFGEVTQIAVKKFYVCQLLIFFLSGMTWNALAAGVAIWLKNRYFVFVFPYLLYRVYSEAAKAFRIPVDFRIDYWYEGRVQPFSAGICIAILVGFSLGGVVAAIFLLYRSLKWRLEDGWN